MVGNLEVGRERLLRKLAIFPLNVHLAESREPSKTGHGHHFMCLRDCSFSRQSSSINSVSTTMRCFNVVVHGFV